MPRKPKTLPAVEEPSVAAAPAAAVQPAADAPKKQLPKYALPAVLLVAVLVVAGLAIWISRLSAQRRLESKKTSASSQQQSQQAAPVDETQGIIAAVGKLVVLPSDEQPTIATVTDLAQLKSQPFFANAEVGDKVLIYTNARKAILYRPSTGQIVELAPLNTSSSAPASAAGASSTRPTVLTLEIRNGTSKNGAAGAWKKKLAGNTGVSVIKTGNAEGSYDQTLLVDLSGGKAPGLVSSLVQQTGAQLVQIMPAGENPSSANMVLIIGKNQ